MLLLHTVLRAFPRTFPMTGRMMAASTEMMAMTTSSSMR